MTKTDGTAIDTIFTGAYSASIKTLSVLTNDFAKAATYPMLVKVSYTELTQISMTQTFSIAVNNPCLTDSFTIDASKFAFPALT